MEIQDYNPNLNEIAEEVLLGPQAEILEKINQFNNRYQTDIKCTKTFRWSPGVGDKLKKSYEKLVLAFNMRYSGVYYFFNRINDRRYYHTNMQRSLIEIDNRMSQLRRDGIRFQDNTEIIQTSFDNTKEKIVNELQTVKEMYDPKVFNMGVYVDVNEHDPTDIKYRLEIRWENPVMGIYNNGEKLVDLKLYPVEINIEFNMLKHLNQVAGNARRISVAMSTIGDYKSPADPIKFPYISQYNGRGGAVCWGSHSGDITQAASQFNLIELSILLNQWISRYDTSFTNPHNQPHTSYPGVPRWLARQEKYSVYRSLQSRDTHVNCGVPLAISDLNNGKVSYAVRNDTTCDDIDCALRDRCDYYNRVVNVTEERLSILDALDSQISYFTPSQYNNLMEDEEIDLYTIAFMNRSYSIDTLMQQYNEYVEEHEDVCEHNNPPYECETCLDEEAVYYEESLREEGEERGTFDPERIAEEATTDEERILRWYERQIERNNNR